jgi:DUF1680 family protein
MTSPAGNHISIPIDQVRIDDVFWLQRFQLNQTKAIFYQWGQLEATGCIENFRIQAKIKEGFRVGRFYADSDAYKWLEAACWIYAQSKDPQLLGLIDEFVQLIEQTQQSDGYIYTYNQFHFPGQRWICQQIEHEMYCMGHLIEAAIAHHLTFHNDRLLKVAQSIADLCVRELSDPDPKRNDGHEEMEIALIKLYRICGNSAYLTLAKSLLDRRGRIRLFPFHMSSEARLSLKRLKTVDKEKERYQQQHPDYYMIPLLPEVYKKFDFNQIIRGAYIGLTGRLLQQHEPFFAFTQPEGHAVRFVYLMTAWTLLYQETKDKAILTQLENLWNRMVIHRMYVTGGIGSVPLIEGFGWDDELPNEKAYGETCAALGTIFWNWEMSLATKKAMYADLLEWQLYNAASSGIAVDGQSYLYRNPLAADEKLKREPWFGTPCCPSNISRVWATLGKYCYSMDQDHPNEIYIHQYIGNTSTIECKNPITHTPVFITLRMTSQLPWNPKICLNIESSAPIECVLNLRIPHWANLNSTKIIMNGKDDPSLKGSAVVHHPIPVCASGFNPFTASYLPIKWNLTQKTQLFVDFQSSIVIHTAPPAVKANRGKVALSLGPIVYCCESIDNLNQDPRQFELDLSSQLEIVTQNLLIGEIPLIKGKMTNGNPCIFIPYFLWANRGNSKMAVWIKAKNNH